MSTPTGGGAAAAAGLDFQNRVAAWITVAILGEIELSIPWGLPGTTSLTLLRCETEQPLDDVLVGTSDDGFLYGQIKRQLDLSDRANSDFYRVLDQVVRQFLACKKAVPSKKPWERPLDATKDRLVIAVGPRSSGPIRHDLPALLDRVRGSGQLDFKAVPRNEDEQRALGILLSGLSRVWATSEGNDPSDSELREVLTLLWVTTFDVEPDGVSEREAKNGLRQSVLQDAAQAEQAWSILVGECARMASDRSGADRPRLQSLLQRNHVSLRIPHSYRDDVGRLQDYSNNTVEWLDHLGCIRVGTTVARVARKCTAQLLEAAQAESIVVVGEPGAGKSGALHELVIQARDDQDVIFLAVDRLEASTDASLRSDLGLRHNLYDVLANWPGSAPALLVIDALDAARAEQTARVLRDLMRRVIQSNDRWRVVAAIRKFDLQYSPELQALFAGEPASMDFRDSDFGHIRHLSVPRLSDNELAQLLEQVPVLETYVSTAPLALRELLSVPFNLRILGELVGAGALTSESTIRTQIELLNEYWRRRIIGEDGQGDARERILRSACGAMVETRSLRVERSGVDASGTSTDLRHLLSSHVLSEWKPSPAAKPQRYILTFAHHMLFDYAVARIIFSAESANLRNQLAADPELAVAFRQSIVLYFRQRWSDDATREYFWDLVLSIAEDNRIHRITMLVGPSVAAEAARSLSDLEPLFVRLDDIQGEQVQPADEVLRHLVGAVLTAQSTGLALVGPQSGPWAEFLARSSESLRTPVMYRLRPLMSSLCDDPSALTPEQRTRLGVAARRFLKFGWDQIPGDRWFCGFAIQAVCRTFESDSQASAELLGRMLVQPHLSERGFSELTFLDNEIKRLMPLHPAFVGRIYESVFSYDHKSKSPTAMGGSRIISLTSNEAQDYDTGRYQLAEIFGDFIDNSPLEALRALIKALAFYAAQSHASGFSEVVESFSLRGRQARIRTDLSSIWDGGDVYHHDHPLKMLNTWGEYLDTLAGSPDRQSELVAIIDLIAAENEVAVFWRRLLSFGTRFPLSVGKELHELGWAIPVLRNIDTTQQAGEFLAQVFSEMSSEERTRVENAIISIPNDGDESQRSFRLKLRNRLLGCLPQTKTVTAEARNLVEELRAQDAIPPNRPFVGRVETSWEEFTTRQYLAEEGVAVEDAANQESLALQERVKPFVDQHRSKPPNAEEMAAALPGIQALEEGAKQAAAGAAHPRLLDTLWATLAEACAAIANARTFGEADPAALLAQRVLLEASNYPDPRYDESAAEQFNRFPSWGPAARIDAASGLTVLCRHDSYATEAVREAVTRLSRDAVPAVRFHVLRVVNALYGIAPDQMWQILERACKEDLSFGVLSAAVTGPLHRLAISGTDVDRVVKLIALVLSRASQGAGSKEIRQACGSLFAGLYLWRGHEPSGKILLDLLAQPRSHAEELHSAIVTTRGILIYGPVEPSDSAQDTIRKRAIDFIQRTLTSAQGELRVIEGSFRDLPFDKWPPEAQEQGRSVALLVEQVGMQLYFSSGAYQGRARDAEGNERSLTDEERKRFLVELQPILEQLATVGIPSIAHHLLETLEVLIASDPGGVFLIIGAVVRGAKVAGYHYESLAVNLIVRLVERYLADYRVLLREDERCRQVLLEVLDTFVDAGWPAARRLTYRLEEIWR